MAYSLNRHDVATWLRRNGFVERHGSSGHVYFTHATSGVKIVLLGHGPNDLPKHVAGNIVRQLAEAGFDKKKVREELRIGSTS